MRGRTVPQGGTRGERRPVRGRRHGTMPGGLQQHPGRVGIRGTAGFRDIPEHPGRQVGHRRRPGTRLPDIHGSHEEIEAPCIADMVHHGRVCPVQGQAVQGRRVRCRVRHQERPGEQGRNRVRVQQHQHKGCRPGTHEKGGRVRRGPPGPLRIPQAERCLFRCRIRGVPAVPVGRQVRP